MFLTLMFRCLNVDICDLMYFRFIIIRCKMKLRLAINDDYFKRKLSNNFKDPFGNAANFCILHILITKHYNHLMNDATAKQTIVNYALYTKIYFCKLLQKLTASYSCITKAISFYIAKYISIEENRIHQKLFRLYRKFQ